MWKQLGVNVFMLPRCVFLQAPPTSSAITYTIFDFTIDIKELSGIDVGVGSIDLNVIRNLKYLYIKRGDSY